MVIPPSRIHVVWVSISPVAAISAQPWYITGTVAGNEKLPSEAVTEGSHRVVLCP